MVALGRAPEENPNHFRRTALHKHPVLYYRHMQDLGRVRDFYETSIEAVRLVRPLMPIIIHDSFRGPMWATMLKDFPYKNIVMVRGLALANVLG